MFTSDNGTTHLKGSLYEGGIRVPLIVKWPGRVKAGGVSSFRTGTEDWMPTLLDLIGAKTEAPKDIDGFSVAGAVLGKKQKPRKFLYREFTGYGGQQAVWMGKWKGVRQNMLKKSNKDPLKIELYDLKADISESKDQAGANPKVVARIRRIMKEQHTPDEIFKFPPID